MIRSVIAVVTGFLLIGALSFGATALMKVAMPGALTARTESVPVLLLVMTYVAIFAVAGCYITALIAGRSPMKHALVLGVLGLIFNVVGTIDRWDTMPAWFHVTSLLLVMPYAWLGGRLRELQLRRTQAA